MLELLYGNMEVRTYGDKLKKERILLGMTQREYSKFKDISYKELIKLECGIIDKI